MIVVGVTDESEDKGALLEIRDLSENKSAFEVGIG